MSFCKDVKDELVRQSGSSLHCQLAELASIIGFAGNIQFGQDDRLRVGIRTENYVLAKRFAGLLWKAFRMPYEVRIRVGSHNGAYLYGVIVTDPQDAYDLLCATGFIDEQNEFYEELNIRSNPLLRRDCCRRAYLRGSFLAAGSMSNPENSYHLDITCGTEERAQEIRQILESLSIPAKITCRKYQWIVYIKDSEAIVEVLGNLGATNALMEMENQRILKEMRNNVNRQVNCETANIHKTVSAAMKQIQDIQFLDEQIGLRNLPHSLAEMAQIRLEYPNATLTELGERMDPPVGKSGVNHRLRKLTNMASKLRME